MANWYFRVGNQEYGPIPLAEISRLAAAGELTVNDWVREGDSNPWRPVSKSPQIMAALNTPRPAAAPPARRLMPQPAPAPARPAPQPAATLTSPRPAPPKPMPAPAPARAPAPAPVGRPVAAAQNHEEKPSVLHERRRSSSGPIIALVCGVGGVAVVGALVLLMSMSGGDDDAIVAAAPAKKPAKVADETSSDGKLSVQQVNMTKGVKAWRDADKGLSLKGLISFEIQRVYWLDGSNAAAPDTQKLPAAASGPVLCVELSITNVSNAPLTMTSWNSRGKSGAWVVDDQLKFVGFTSGSGGSLSLAPSQTITDTLQFSTGSKDFSELRLVLPYAALARSGQSGYRLDAATLAGQTKTQPEASIAKAANPKKPEPSKPEEPPETTIIQAPTPEDDPAVATNKAPEVDTGEPKEDIRDIIRKEAEKEKKKD